MGGGGKAPKVDPRIGEAAMASARTGQQALDFMKKQAGISNRWAAQDRGFYMGEVRPMEREFIQEAQGWDTLNRRNAEAARARGMVETAAAQGRGQVARQLTAMGVDPRSGRFQETMAAGGLATKLAGVGADNTARAAVRAQGDAKEAAALNLGRGFAVNPGTALGMAGNAGSAGFSAAMGGYGQQGSLLNQDYQNRLSTWQANQDASSSLWGGIGALGGTFLSNPGMLAGGLSFLSDETAKTDRARARGALDALMKMPSETYRYKPGAGDGGAEPHVGPMAQDFRAATGQGDGRTIPVQDLIGVTVAAVQELAGEVRAMKGRGLPKPKAEPANAPPPKAPDLSQRGRGLPQERRAA